MNAVIRTLALAGAAVGGLAVSGCLHAQMTAHAAALPVYAAEQPHPAVTKALGPVKTDICLWSENETSIVNDALNDLRADADAKGATALVDYHYAFKANSPRVQQCRRYIEAQATAVIIGGAG